MDFSIDLPAETVEGLFCEQEDDHAALPHVALYSTGRRPRGFVIPAYVQEDDSAIDAQ